MKVILDRIEEDIAVFVDSECNTYNVPFSEISFAPCEGDAFLAQTADSGVIKIISRFEDEPRKRRIRDLFDKLKSGDESGK